MAKGSEQHSSGVTYTHGYKQALETSP